MSEDWRIPESAYSGSESGDWPGNIDYDDHRDAVKQRRWLDAGKTGWWWQAPPEECAEVFGLP